VTDFAATERAALADLFLALGPDAPTLCAGWTTRDLAAHLVVRGTRPLAAAGIVIPRLSGLTRRAQAEVAATDWPDLVARARRRPRLMPVGDELLNRFEYFVHHEDVRRAQPDWRPRDLPTEQSAGLWARIPAQARLVLRRTPAAVTVTAPGHGTATGGRGGPPVELSGEPQELALFLSGRQDHARVELTGPPEITDRMRHARYGV
jgi:uncharacterized protein (TIGR03085 family)